MKLEIKSPYANFPEDVLNPEPENKMEKCQSCEENFNPISDEDYLPGFGYICSYECNENGRENAQEQFGAVENLIRLYNLAYVWEKDNCYIKGEDDDLCNFLHDITLLNISWSWTSVQETEVKITMAYDNGNKSRC